MFISALAVIGLALAPAANAGEPCCNVISVNAKSGLVTAKNTKTGQTVQFQVDNRAVLKRLKVGQSVWVDQGTQKVSVDGLEPCCAIVR